jgi:hypothetical protein
VYYFPLQCVPQKLWQHNLSKTEWLALKTLTEDNSIIIKPADKGSCVVVWDRDVNVYTKMERFSEESVMSLTEESNNMFHKLYNQGCISKNEFKYFSYDFKNSCALWRLYLLPKIHKRLRNVPGRPVISNCGTPTERASEFLDHHLKPNMKAGKSYIRDTGHFLDKLKEIGKISENALLVTGDVTSLYPSIPHEDGLRTLHTKLEEREDKTVS